MKRLYYSCPNRNYSVKMFEAPVAWQRYPNATTRVTSNTVKAYAFHDKPRLFSALIRVTRRKMTMNEASASHKLTINIIREVYQTIFNTMCDVVMKLMDDRRIDMDLLGNELNEENFPYDEVTEEDLIIAKNEKGEDYAYIDTSAPKPKKSNNPGEIRFKTASESLTVRDVLFPRRPPVLLANAPKEEKPSTSTSYAHTLVQTKEEKLDDYPVLVPAKEEDSLDVFSSELLRPKLEVDPFPCHYVLPKEEVMGGYADDLVLPKEENENVTAIYGDPLGMDHNRFMHNDEDMELPSYSGHLSEQYESGYGTSTTPGTSYSLEPMFKFEDDLYLGDKEIKQEPMDDPILSQHNDQGLYPGGMNEFGYYGEDGDFNAVKQEEEDIHDEDENVDIVQAIDMALTSSKIFGSHAAVMKAALKDSMIHDVAVADIVKVYKFSDQSSICNLINKARVFLKGICRKAGKGLPATFASSSAYKRDFKPGPPLDPMDTYRIQNIRDFVAALSRRCMYPKMGKEALSSALFAVCIGELTLNAASNKFNLPSSTIQPYIMKARQRLGSTLPPPASAPILWHNQLKKYKPADDPEATIDNSPDASGKQTFAMEQLDRTIAELVMNSHYDQNGKQAIFEGVVAVITTGISAPEASKRTGIPVSTIQTYVGRTRQTLKIPSKNVDFVPRRKEPPTIALLGKKDVAPRKDVEKCAHMLTKSMMDHNRRIHLYRAIVAAVMGEMTIREASEKEELPASSVHPYVTRVRHYLGQRCPPAKLVSNLRTPTLASRKGERIDDEQLITITEDEAVTIDGISVPRSIRLLGRLMTVGQIDYSKALAFTGTKEELKDKIVEILIAFRFKGDCSNLAKGIIHVYVDDKTISEACLLFKLSHTTLASYARAIKVFIDFALSPCSKEYQYADYKKRSIEVMKDIQGAVEREESIKAKSPRPKPPPLSLPKPPLPTRFASEPLKVEVEEMKKRIKNIQFNSNGEEYTSFLSEDDRQKDLLWNGEGLDYITRTMKLRFPHKYWKYDVNGDSNAELVQILLQPKISKLRRMERLKCVIQYVVNDRNTTRERLYIRPLLIHHLCNGFTLNYLFSIYEDRVPLTEDELNEYCYIIENMFAKTSNIILECATNLTKCGKILDVNDEEKEQNRKEQHDLIEEMTGRFPFLAHHRTLPVTTEKLSQALVVKRKYEGDFYVYYALQAATELRDVGFLITNALINELVRITLFNIPSSICSGLNAVAWFTQYIKFPLVKHSMAISRGAFRSKYSL